MTTPEEVCEAFVDESGWPKPVPVSRRQISAWMASPSLEVRGALFHFLRERAEISRVETPFTPEELFPFITGYFEDCLAVPEEVAYDSKWILGSTDLTHAIAYWASDFWKQQRGPGRGRSCLISWLRSVLLRFPQYRRLLATALADHLFFQKRIRKGFVAWASDPELAPLFPELIETRTSYPAA
jgi:hypothetical protein